MSSASRSVAGLSPDKLQQLIDRLQVRHPPGAAGRIPRQQRDGSPLPLSFGQERIWLLHHYEPESAAYNLPLVFELRGTLSRPRLAAALSEVVRRHESLRTIFAERAGELSQHIQPAAAVELPLVDLDSLPQDRRAAAAERLAERHVLTPFDLSRGPLLTAALVRSGPQAHRFMLTVHHIAADGWSMVVLVRELAQIYHAAGAGLPPPLPELPIQYADFALWQRRELAGFEQQDLPFWLEQLAGDPPVLGLPTDRPRTAVQTYRGGQLARAFGPELTGDLRALSSRRRATLLMTLHAGLAVVLQRWSGQEDLLLGTPVAGRRRVETEGLIGFFLNTLVLRLDLSGEPTFDELLERARAVALDALSHQDLPFEAVLARLRPERTAWGTPLFQVLLNVLNFPRSEIELPELTIDLMATPAMPAKFDLTLYVHQDDAGLACDLVYNADLFAAGRIEELFEQWRILLAQAVEQPAKRISELSLITPAALALLPASGEELLPVWKGAIHARFAEWVQHQPQRLAVEDAFGAWTYGDLAAASRAVRAALEQAGIGAEQPVAIYAHRSAALLAAVLGILQAGAAFMILDPAYPPPQLLDRLTAVPPRAWIQLEAAGPPPAEVARFLALHPPAVVVHLAPALPSSSPAGDEISGDVTTADCLAYIAFTSGSTGEPKAICGTQRPLSHFLAWHAGQFGLGQSDRFSVLSGLAHDPLLRDLFTPLWVGGSVHLPGAEILAGGTTLERWLRESRITVVHLTPALGQVLASGADRPARPRLDRLRYAFFGGDRLRGGDVRRLRRLAPTVRCVSFYGATETPQAMAWCEASPSARQAAGEIVPLGRGIDGVQLLVLGRGGNLAGIGELGEIAIRSPYLARGYLDPYLTAARFVPDLWSESGSRLYRTGDLGRYLPNGEVSFARRADRQVKVRGFRVELGEVEAALAALPGVERAAVAMCEERGEQRLVAYVVGTGERPLGSAELRARAEDRLLRPLVPSAFIVLPHLPLTPNGKVDWRALPAPAADSALERRYQAPATDCEREIAAIWQAVLGVERVGVHDHFFELGGHSLLLVSLHGRLEETLGVELSLIDLFSHPTVASQAEHIGAQRRGAQVAALPPPAAAASLHAALGRHGRGDPPEPAGLAIVGMAGRFPGAADVSELWRNLRAGVESVSFFSDAELLAAGVPPELVGNPRYVKARAMVGGEDLFDAAFFALPPRQAELTDPQHRLFLECCWHALESAGIDSERFPGAIGVYAGMSVSSYLVTNLLPHPGLVEEVGAGPLLIATDRDFLTAQVSYRLGLRGPSLDVQTACSTSLVAVHLACQALLAGDCDAALAGGVSVWVPQRAGYLYQPAGTESSDGHCRAFDARADGAVPGSGAGVVVLKRLADALADGDLIHGVVLGSALSHDGSRKLGFTAPGVEGQAAAVARALARAGAEPGSIGYVECHGSATALGDPIEVTALCRAFGEPANRGRCAIGSVKTNVGHLGAAAGVTGLIKAVLALEHREIPPSLHFETPNPKIDFAASPFYVNDRLADWQDGRGPRRAGVNSLGLGGTNAHVVLQEAPERTPSGASRPWQLLVLSAPTETALETVTERLAAWIERQPEAELADAAFTLQQGRRAFAHRRALVCATSGEARRILAERDPRRLLSGVQGGGRRTVAFLLTGVGDHYPGMARGLYDSEPVFRAELDRCFDILGDRCGRELRDALFAGGARAADGSLDLRRMLGRGGDAGAAARRLHRTRFAQPAVFAVNYALARLWMSWGVEPEALLGYSLGEYVAACLAGIFALEEALPMVAERARWIEELPAGAMLAVPLPEDEVRDRLAGAMAEGTAAGLDLAAVDGPHLCVVSGPADGIAGLTSRLAAEGVTTRRLATTHAFHSRWMEPVAARLTEQVRCLRPAPPRIPCLSNVTGTWLRPEEAQDPTYWARHLCGTVRFAEGLGELWQNPARVLLEIGPGQALTALALQHPTAGRARLALPSLPHAHERHDDAAFLLGALGRLWLAGIAIDWTAFSRGEQRRRLELPLYPFERRRFWIEPPETGLAGLQVPARDRSAAAAAAPVPPLATVPMPPAVPALGRHERPRLPHPYVAPRSALEAQIATHIERLLGLAGVGVHDSFFELGGQSLLGTQLLSRLRDELGIEVPIEALFAAPTAAELARVAAAARLAAGMGQDVKTVPPIVPVGRDRALPLSFAQQRLWFLAQLQQGSSAYNVTAAFRLRGRLDRLALGASYSEVVRRHEALRTAVSFAADQPVQAIAPATPCRPALADLSGLPPEAALAVAQELAVAQARHPFTLTRAPLVRLVLMPLAEQDHVLVATMHHIVSDAWSMGVLAQELGTLYGALLSGGSAGLQELEIQYADFAHWQRSWLVGEALDAELGFWKERLGPAPAVLDLPTDRPRPAIQSFAGATLPLLLAPALVEGLQALSRRSGLTLFMTLLAGFQALLGRYSHQDEIVVGTPIAGRNHRQTESLIGFFVNMLAMRADLAGDPALPALLAQVRRNALAAYAHQELPFEKLVSELRLERNLGRTPLFQVVFALQNAPFAPLALAGLEIEPLAVHNGTAKFDLTATLSEIGGRLQGALEYSCDLFDKVTVARLARHFEVLLAGAVARPQQLLSQLPLLSVPERFQLLREWNDTARECPQQLLVHELFAAHARCRPHVTAVASRHGRLTYGELEERANVLAHCLRRRGVGPEELVAICTDRSLERIVGIVGVLKAGGAYVSLDPGYPGERLAFLLADSGARVLLTEQRFAALLPRCEAEVVHLDADWEAVRTDSTGLATCPESGVGPENLAYVVYTSGSTGKPKGVEIPHGGLSNLVHWYQRCFDLHPGDRGTQIASPAFDASVVELWPFLAGGGELYIPDEETRLSPQAMVRWWRETGITLAYLMTPLAEGVLEHLDSATVPPPHGVRALFTGGDRLHRRPGPGAGFVLWNTYGPAEYTVTTSAVAVPPWSSWTAAGGATVPAAELPTIGRPLPNTRIYVVDGRLEPVPVGVPGELLVAGAGLARSYLRQPGLTAEKFVPDPWSGEGGARMYRTADLVRRRADGDLEFLGRIDHQVKVRGFRIELGEIESALARHPEIKEAAVVAREERPQEKRLVAYIVWQSEAQEGTLTGPRAASLRELLRESLPDYMVPAAFVALSALPQTPNGKVDRLSLPPPEIEPTSYEAPRSSLEESLARIWSELLGIKRVGVLDNFFDLGGDSILAIQIISRVAQAGWRLTPRQVFETPTIAALAAAAVAARTLPEPAEPPHGEVPLTPIQRRFFAQELVHQDHFNQSLLLTLDASRGRPEPGLVGQALATVLSCHEMLAARFEPGPEGWRQVVDTSMPWAWWTQVDLGAIPEPLRGSAVSAAAGALQASLDLVRGRLVRAAIFTAAAPWASRLFLSVHHLVVDGVSWRILLEEVETVYRQLARGEVPSPPPRTSSFKRWSEALIGYTRSQTAAVSYWLDGPAERHRLPLDLRQGANTAGSVREAVVALSEEDTRALLQAVPHAYRTQAVEVLLTGVAEAIAWWTGERRLSIELESHGREPIAEDLDLSRTVGWFTSLYPVHLDLRGVGAPGDSLRAVKEQLRRVPEHGLAYGAVRYLTAGEEAAELARRPRPEVIFNYLGQTDQAVAPERLFRPATETVGPQRDPRQVREHLLEVTARVAGGRLSTVWAYSANRHRQETVERLSSTYLNRLREVIAHCVAPGAGGVTPADFPLAQVSQATLDILASGGPIEDLYPASPVQQGMIFHSLAAPRSGVYVEQLSLELGGLDPLAFERACAGVVDRYAILRTGFMAREEREILQVVRRVAPVVERRDWRGLSAAEQWRALSELLHEDRQRGFDVAVPPLMRFILLETGADTHRLVWSFHHALLDGWSLAILLREVFSSYGSGGELRPGTGLPRARPYRDYVAWLARQDLGLARDYWRRILGGFTVPTPLPIDRPPAPADSVPAAERYGHLGLQLPSAVGAALTRLARRQRVTSNTLLQGAWALLLSRYCGSEDVVFGVVSSGRSIPLPGIDTMVGLFINTLPCRIRVDPRRKLGGWLAGLQALQAEIREFEHSPLSEVLGESDVPRGVPLFESILAFENFPVSDVVRQQARSGLRLGDADFGEQTNYPLNVVARPGAALIAKLVYDRTRFDAVSIGRLLGHLANLLGGMHGAVDRPLWTLSLLSAGERHQALHEWNDTAKDCPQVPLVHVRFALHAQRHPGAIAIGSPLGALTYGEVEARANRLAHHLAALGVGAETLVALCTGRTLERVVAIVGVLKAGAAYVSLDPTYPRERLAWLLEDAGAPVVLTERRFAAVLPESRARVLYLDSDWESIIGQKTHPPACRVQPENLAYVVYTSGSTGTPKGVEIPHAGLTNLVRWHQDLYRVGPADRGTQIASPAFDASIWELWPYLAAGASVHVPDEEVRLSSPGMIRWWSEAGITLAYLMTPLAAGVLEEPIPPGLALPVRALIIGGDRLHRRPDPGVGFQLMNHYGPAEYTVTSTVIAVPPQEPGSTAPALPSIGRPLDNTQIHILDRAQQEVPIGVVGELYVAGVGLARGYHHAAELTAARFVPDPFAGEPGARMYRTGDLVRFLVDGEIDFLGRLDHQVKLRGVRVELGEIESVLCQHPEVREAAVLVAEDRPGSQRLVAYLAPAAGCAPRGEQLRGFLAERLPAGMVPSLFVTLEALPLTPNGKVDRRALPAPEADREPSYAVPRDAVEEMVATAWQEVLKVPRVGIHDDFFALGGHSLSAVQAVLRLRGAMGVEVPLRLLFERPTVALLAPALSEQLRRGMAPPPPLRAVPHLGGAPLSFAQQRLWVLHQMERELGRSAYIIAMAVRLRGRLEVTAFAAALGELVRRHEVLRTTFDTRAGEPLQFVGAAGRYEPAHVDLRGLPPERREMTVGEIARASASRLFDLAKGPLFRTLLVGLPGEHLLVASMHHIVSDAWSAELLTRELGILYGALVEHRPSPLPELTIQYADFACWQRQWLSGEMLAAELDHWRQRLAGMPVLELTTDRMRPAVATLRGAGFAFTWPESLRQRLHRLAAQQSATVFAVLLAGFDALLGRYSGQEDLVIGTPVANRTRAEIEGLIGFFVNSLVLRLDLSGNPTFGELLARARQVVLEASAHQDLPFEKLVEELQPARSLSRSPLFQVVLALQNVAPSPLALSGLEVTAVPLGSGTAKFDLSVTLAEQAEGLAGYIEYSTDLFEAVTARRLLDHLERLLAGAVASPGLRLDELPLLSAVERWQALHEWNDTATSWPRLPLVHERFAWQARLRPEATAVADWRGRRLSYGELERRANRLAQRLRGLGVGPETLVALCTGRTLERVMGVVATLKAGGAYVSLDPGHPRERLALVLADAGVAVVLTEQSYVAALPAGEAPVICLDGDDELAWVEGPVAAPAVEVTAENLAYVVYTSGSTGKPKGVEIPHGGLSNLVHWYQRCFDLHPGDRGTQIASPAFDASVVELWPFLAGGGELYIPDEETRLSPQAMVRWWRETGITLAYLMTPLAEGVLEHLDSATVPPPHGVRALFTGGDRLHRRPGPGAGFVLWNTYGPAEYTVTTSAVAVPPWSSSSRWTAAGGATVPTAELPTIGRPLPNTRIYAVDGRLEPVPVGVPGELLVAGAGLARSYLRQPGLTAEKFVPDPWSGEGGARMYRTADLVRRRADGDLEFLGRIDHQVKVRGFRIELGEIESALARHPEIKEAVVVAREERPQEKRLVAYAVPAGAKRPSVEELRGFLRQWLPEYMVPAAFLLLDALPLTPNGKVDRRALPALEAGPEAVYVAPHGAIEEKLAAAWCAVLGIERVGRDDNFFEVGGHSLLVVRLRDRLQRDLEREIQIIDLFQHTTLKAMAAHLAARPQPAEAAIGDPGQAQALRTGRQRREQLRRRREEARA